jgi:hypothetical protein
LPRKSRQEDDEKLEDDDAPGSRKNDDDDDLDDDDEDTIDLDTAEEEEEDEDEEEDEEDEEKKAVVSVDDLERRKVFQSEAEEILEHLTLDDIKEVLSENEQETSLAPKLRKFLVEVIHEGEVDNMDDAWEEALDRLEESEA